MPYLQKRQCTRLKLRVSCEELNRIFYKDVLDAVLVIKAHRYGEEPRAIYSSAPVRNSFSPVFPEEVALEHTFESTSAPIAGNQRYIFLVYHDGHPKNAVGQAELSIKELLTAPGGVAVRELNSGFKAGGRLAVRAAAAERNSEFICLQLRGERLLGRPWWSWFGGQRLFFKLSRTRLNHSESLYVSECQPYNKIMQWSEFYIQYNPSYQEQRSRVRIQLCSQKAQSEEILAEAELEWSELHKLPAFEVLDRESRPAGRLAISSCRLEREHGFDEFVRAGLEINLTVAIDFSASIKNASHPDSPHHSGRGNSRYLDALLALSSFVLDYCANKRASVFSVGAKVRHPKVYTGDKVQQCFPLSGDFENPALEGAKAISAAYHSILNHLEFSGPTDFTEVVRQAQRQCLAGKHRKEEFSVLLVLSDGKLTNTRELREALEDCATLPIYVVFLAVGSGCSELQELSSARMEVYTGDKCLAERQDMVNVGSYAHSGQDLPAIASQLFKNLPHVVSHYMSLRKRTPEQLEKAISKKLGESRASESLSNNPEV